MKKMRTWAGLLLALAAILLAGCSAGDEKPEREEGTLIYAALNPVATGMQKKVDIFNQTHTDIQISIQDYSDEGGPQRLLTELAAGRIPDIMEMQAAGTVSVQADANAESLWFGDPLAADTSGNYWMPYRQLAQKGYLEDLWPYIENDPDLGREGVLEAPLKAAEVDGGLYMLFGQVSVNTLMGAKSVVGDRCGWTLAELVETFSDMPGDATVLRYNAVKRDVFYKLFSSSLDQYVDWESAQCAFDSNDFRNTLEFLNYFPSSFDTALAPEQLGDELFWRLADGRQMLEPIRIGLLKDMPYYDTYFDGGASYIGYPTADGSFGGTFIIHGSKLAMSSSCQDKEAAWEFIRQLILKNYDENSMEKAHRNQQVRIPINRKDYELGNNVDLSSKSVAPRSTFTGGPTYDVATAAEKDLQHFEALINNTTQIYWPNDSLSDIVWEALGPYFAGDKTMDETIALLQDRVRLYVNEQK